MEFLNKFNPKELIAVIAILGGVLIAVVAILGGVWYASSRNRHDAFLRKEMLDRGMSAAEIEQAMRGFAAPVFGANAPHSNVRYYDAELAKALASSEVGYSAQTIEYVMTVFRAAPDVDKHSTFNAISEMIKAEAANDALLAAVRSLCRSPEPRREFDSHLAASERHAGMGR